ncbi:MAG: lamin tail domain-containing protein [Deltaproteobacteria bacterium]|nr:lamin tail domain-containing protein [Deltaproteobacteria bacterium]
MKALHRDQAVLCSLLIAFGLAAGCGPGERPELASIASPVELAVPGDYATIQAALDAAGEGDTVVVAAGEFSENVRFRRRWVSLQGAGPESTVLHGTVDSDGIWGLSVSGFRISSTSPQNGYGLNMHGAEFSVSDCIIEGFYYGIRIENQNVGDISGNIIRQCLVGIPFIESPGITVHDNLILNNSEAGIKIYSFSAPEIVHNTIVGNGFGAALEDGGGIMSRNAHNEEVAQNNILVSNHAGMNIGAANADNHHNLVWGNVQNYVAAAAAGAGDVSLDPRFVDPANKDYRLWADSPAVDRGVLWSGMTFDLDGNPRPVGDGPDLGAYENQQSGSGGDLVITEVLANPLDESRGEFVELYNPTASAVDAAGLILDDGDSTDPLVAYQGGPTLVPAGGYAVVLDRDYGELGAPYEIGAGAVLLTVPNAAIGSGLSVSDPILIWRAGSIVSTYLHPFDPGNGLSAERIDAGAADTAGNWMTSPCGMSPGSANGTSCGSPPSIVISEVMASPAIGTEEEFVELYNLGDSPVELAGLVLSDGDSTDVLIGVGGKSSTLGAGDHGIIIDPDLIPHMDQTPYFLDGAVPVVVTVENTALGNGLAMNDPISLFAADGTTLIATYSHPIAASGQSIERIDPQAPDLPDNWIPSPCEAGHSAGRPNCAYSPGPEGPELVISEVMANPIDEDTGEFVEIYNPTDQAIDVAGMLLCDGDTTDAIQPYEGSGTTLIPAHGYGVILDPEYASDYAIPGEAILLSPENTALGNSLATTDPVSLLASDGLTVISSYSFPFNPGNGISVERIGTGPDEAGSWVASPCPSGSSPGADNCAH